MDVIYVMVTINLTITAQLFGAFVVVFLLINWSAIEMTGEDEDEDYFPCTHSHSHPWQ